MRAADTLVNSRPLPFADSFVLRQVCLHFLGLFGVSCHRLIQLSLLDSFVVMSEMMLLQLYCVMFWLLLGVLGGEYRLGKVFVNQMHMENRCILKKNENFFGNKRLNIRRNVWNNKFGLSFCCFFIWITRKNPQLLLCVILLTFAALCKPPYLCESISWSYVPGEIWTHNLCQWGYLLCWDIHSCMTMFILEMKPIFS